LAKSLKKLQRQLYRLHIHEGRLVGSFFLPIFLAPRSLPFATFNVILARFGLPFRQFFWDEVNGSLSADGFVQRLFPPHQSLPRAALREKLWRSVAFWIASSTETDFVDAVRRACHSRISSL
jgi:hypothetical protein